MKSQKYLILIFFVMYSFSVCYQTKPVGVRFDTSTLLRKGNFGDNWCQTWAIDDNVYTILDDGNGWWGSSEKLNSLADWEGSMFLQISGDQNFTEKKC